MGRGMDDSLGLLTTTKTRLSPLLSVKGELFSMLMFIYPLVCRQWGKKG